MLKTFWKKLSTKEHKQPMGKFLKKAAILSFGLIAAIPMAVNAFSERYFIAIDFQNHRCLPDHFIYLVDLQDKDIKRGELFAFEVEGAADIIPNTERLSGFKSVFADGQRLLKVLDGMPGDTIEVSRDAILVNGQPTGVPSLALHKTLQQPIEAFEKTFVLEDDKLFFGGRSYDSFDSRYYGTISKTRIVGHAYPIL